MITQLATLKKRLKIRDEDVVDDELLTRIIDATYARFEKECNRKLARQAAATFEFRANVVHILVDRYPIESVTTFELKSNETDGWEAEVVDYLLTPSRAMIEFASEFGSDTQIGRVTFTGGFVMPGTDPGAGQTALPDDLEDAAIEQIAYWYRNKDKLGLSSVSGQSGSIAFEPKSVVNPLPLLAPVQAVLKSYTRMIM